MAGPATAALSMHDHNAADGGWLCAVDSNTKTCYPATLPIYLVDLSVEESRYVSALAPCLQCSQIDDAT